MEKPSVLVGRILRCGGGEGLNPISWWDTSLKQERVNNIIDGSDNAFSFTVFRRGIWTGHPELDAVGEEESTGSVVVDLATIITLDTLNGNTELCGNIGKEIRQGRESIRLQPQWKSLEVMRKIIEYDKIILAARYARNR